MKFNIFKSSVIGYKNLVKGSESQDYIDIKKMINILYVQLQMGIVHLFLSIV